MSADLRTGRLLCRSKRNSTKATADIDPAANPRPIDCVCARGASESSQYYVRQEEEERGRGGKREKERKRERERAREAQV